MQELSGLLLVLPNKSGPDPSAIYATASSVPTSGLPTDHLLRFSQAWSAGRGCEHTTYLSNRTPQDSNSFMWHQPCRHLSTPLQWILKKAPYKKLVTHVESHVSAMSLLKNYKNDQQTTPSNSSPKKQQLRMHCKPEPLRNTTNIIYSFQLLFSLFNHSFILFSFYSHL